MTHLSLTLRVTAALTLMLSAATACKSQNHAAGVKDFNYADGAKKLLLFQDANGGVCSATCNGAPSRANCPANGGAEITVDAYNKWVDGQALNDATKSKLKSGIKDPNSDLPLSGPLLTSLKDLFTKSTTTCDPGLVIGDEGSGPGLVIGDDSGGGNPAPASGPSGACTITCDDQSKHCAVGPQSQCLDSVGAGVSDLFHTAGVGHPTCLYGAPVKFDAGGSCPTVASGPKGACTITCDDQSKHCAVGPQSQCLDSVGAGVSDLFHTAGVGHPTCLYGAPVKFDAGGSCPTAASGPKGACTITCDDQSKHCAVGPQSQCLDSVGAGVSDLFHAAGVGHPTCLYGAPVKFDAGGTCATAPSGPKGACVITCDDQSQHCAIGPQSQCASNGVSDLFHAAGVGHPTCLYGAPLKFYPGYVCN